MNNYEHGFIAKCAEYGVNPNALIKVAQENKGLLDFISGILGNFNNKNRKDEIAKANQFNYDNALTKLKKNNPVAYSFYTHGDGSLIDGYYNNVVMPTLKDPNNPFKPVLGDKYKIYPDNPILRGLSNGNISEYKLIQPGRGVIGSNHGDKVKVLSFFPEPSKSHDPGRVMVHEHLAHNLRDDSNYLGNMGTGKPNRYKTVYDNTALQSDLAAAYPHFSTVGMYNTDLQFPDKSKLRTNSERGAANSELQWAIYKKLYNKLGHQPTAEEFREGIKNLSDTELSQLYANKAFFSGYVDDIQRDNLIDGRFSTGYQAYNSPNSPSIWADYGQPKMTLDEFRNTQLYKLNKGYFDEALDPYFNPDSDNINGGNWITYPNSINIPVKGEVLPKEQLEALRKTLMWFTRNKNKSPAGVSRNQRYLT